MYETVDKAGRQPTGLEGLAGIVAATQLPVLAIGGVTPDMSAQCHWRRVPRVAVMSAIGPLRSILAPGRQISRRPRPAEWNNRRTRIHATSTANSRASFDGTTIQAFLDGRKLHEHGRRRAQW